MPYCHECGKRVSSAAKFCRQCGASQLEESGALEGTVVSPPENAICDTCSSPLLPDETFCGNCGAKTTRSPQAPAAQDPIVSPLPVQPCPSCGNLTDPGNRFCGMCGVPVSQPPVTILTPAPEPAPVPAPPAAVPAGTACAGCGSLLNGTGKFCGTCGGPVAGAGARISPAPATSPGPAVPAGKFCGECGTPTGDTTRFCGACGTPVVLASSVTEVSPGPKTAAPVAGEEVLGVIPNAKKKTMFGLASDTYTVVVTGRRMIFARLTQPMLTAAIAEANRKAKAEGKGFFGIMGDQMAVSFGFGKRYETMPPGQALHETPDNIAIKNQRITAIRLKLIVAGSEGTDGNEFRMSIESMDGNHEYLIAEDDRFTTLLQAAYGDRVKMPSGLFRTGPGRVKFF